MLRGSAQNPDVFFQAREACNPFYLEVPDIVQGAMDKLADLTGRPHRLFDYVGHPEAERVVVLMGSGCGAVEETVEALVARGERVGAVKVRLFRPFSTEALVASMPSTVRRIAVLDRTKEPGAPGEPLYQDVVTALVEEEAAGRVRFDGGMPRVIGGRYGLSSKEFTPAMAKAVFDELDADEPKNHFTVGIVDDVTGTSLPVDRSFTTEPDDVVRAVFFGLGSDGTVSANRNSIKIIGARTDLHAQGYFVLDSKKAGSVTVSHLRFGPRPIRSTYLIEQASFVACHDFERLERSDVLGVAAPGATLLLNSPFGPDEVWDQLPLEVQRQIVDKGLRLFVVDGYGIAKEAGLGTRINTVLQTCFFALADIFPIDEAVQAIKEAIVASYGKRGETVLSRNFAAVDAALAALHEVLVPGAATGDRHVLPPVPAEAPEFVQRVTAKMIAGEGDLLPVSAFPVDGTFPTDTARWEKRSIAHEIPIWDPSICIDCAKCALVCPHAAIRMKVFEPVGAAGRAGGLQGQGMEVARAARHAHDDPGGARRLHGLRHLRGRLPGPQQGTGEAPLDRHGAEARAPGRRARVVRLLPGHPRSGSRRRPRRHGEGLPADAAAVRVLGRLLRLRRDPVPEGAHPAVRRSHDRRQRHRMLLDLRREPPHHAVVVGADGRGPAWANSLFEDNAEFGMGMRLALDAQIELGTTLLEELEDELGLNLVSSLRDGIHAQGDEQIGKQRLRVEELRTRLSRMNGSEMPP